VHDWGKQKLNDLAVEYNTWLTEHHLPPESADELIHAEELTQDEVEWLKDFIKRWEEADNAS
jgi:hypothetical protein